MRTRYPQSDPYRGRIDAMHDEGGASSVGGDQDYGMPPVRWVEEGAEDFRHAGEGGGRRTGMGQERRPDGRQGNREEGRMSGYGGGDYDPDPYGREEPGRDSGRRGLNPDRLRSGSRPGHWGDDRGGSSRTAWWTQGYGDNPANRDWDDVPRDRQGPRGYTRSDERIREHICERLARHHILEVSDVEVAVNEGCVTLEGTVPDRYMKHAIEDTADNCWGVKDVDNRIRVKPRPGRVPAAPQGMDELESEPRNATPKPRGPSNI